MIDYSAWTCTLLLPTTQQNSFLHPSLASDCSASGPNLHIIADVKHYHALVILRIHYHSYTNFYISGVPNPPMNVIYNDMVVIDSSVELQWNRPAYTGGVSVMNYTVTANGGTVVVSGDSKVVSYTSPSLIYGIVLVTAVNSCGQESQPANVTIPSSSTYFM